MAVGKAKGKPEVAALAGAPPQSSRSVFCACWAGILSSYMKGSSESSETTLNGSGDANGRAGGDARLRRRGR